jgi:hypothetical protein
MFDKIKQKATQTKKWVLEHKREIVVGGLGIMTGAVGYALLERREQQSAIDRFHSYMETCETGDNLLVDVIRVERNADKTYWGHGDENNPTISTLGHDLVEKGGAEPNEKVIGALIYTKR